MIKEFIDKWQKDKGKLEEYLRRTPQSEYGTYRASDVYKAHEEEHLKIVNRIKELQYAIAKTQTIVGKLVESAEDEDRLYIKIYADDEPSVKAEKLYQICGETQNREITKWIREYFPPAEATQGGKENEFIQILKSWETNKVDAISKRFISDAILQKISELNAQGEKAIPIAREFIRFKRFVDGLTPIRTEAVQGEWIRVGHDIYECSLCHQNVMTRDIDCYAYCHRCGAKMDKGGDTDEID